MEEMLNATLKAKLFDLSYASAAIVWFGAGIFGLLRQISQLLNSPGDALAICSQLANVGLLSLLILLLIIRRPLVRTAKGVLPKLAGIAGLLLPSLVLILPRAELSPSMTVLSFAIILLGTLIAIVTACWLGRSFSILPQARTLVTEGPYRFVRHPLYLAELIAVFGLTLQYKQPDGLLIMLLAVGAQFPRMYFEEQVLTEAFPSYREYASRIARLIPGVY